MFQGAFFLVGATGTCDAVAALYGATIRSSPPACTTYCHAHRAPTHGVWGCATIAFVLFAWQVILREVALPQASKYRLWCMTHLRFDFVA